jgi:hypothetical protein
MRFRKRGAGLLEKTGLADFSRKGESRAVIWEYMGAVGRRHLIQRLTAALGQNDRIGFFDPVKVIVVRVPAGAEDRLIANHARVKRKNHQ